jgi:hypothetical protein
MGQADWNDLGGALSTASLARGVTGGMARPAGGGDFVYGFNSLDGTVTGAAGKYVDLTGFTPTGSVLSAPDGGGSVRGAVKRVASPNNTGFTPMLFICAQGGPPTVNDDAYILGLSDADPYTIMLAKGPIISGLVDDDSNLYMIGKSSAQYSMGDGNWHHLRLDAIVQPNGDVLLKVFENDLSVRPIADPSGPNWVNVPGFDADGFIDDVLQVNTGSAPLWGGYMGFAFAVANSLNRRGAFDGIEAYRQT